ncbi:hypothetical protein ACFSCX_10490 [Bacillus salitolerans]|uniref:Uncharacterized protein n=1 Tax=Bacillus salitolerans TaxID=1437434 RepID=A0ABW4LRA3_9BACI
MPNQRISKEAQEKQQKVIAAQHQAEQFQQLDTEFAADENVLQTLANSQKYQVQNDQPTYEPNKAF